MTENQRTIEVCSSPKLFDLYDHSDCIVVVIDVLRATSSMCVALAHGAEKIIPVQGIEETRKYKSKGFVIAAFSGSDSISSRSDTGPCSPSKRPFMSPGISAFLGPCDQEHGNR